MLQKHDSDADGLGLGRMAKKVHEPAGFSEAPEEAGATRLKRRGGGVIGSFPNLTPGPGRRLGRTATGMQHPGAWPGTPPAGTDRGARRTRRLGAAPLSVRVCQPEHFEGAPGRRRTSGRGGPRPPRLPAGSFHQGMAMGDFKCQ